MPAGIEGFEKNVFDWQRETVVNLEVATFLRPARMNPVGGPLTGATGTGGVAQGLQQDGARPVAVEALLR